MKRKWIVALKCLLLQSIFHLARNLSLMPLAKPVQAVAGFSGLPVDVSFSINVQARSLLTFV